ncbi:DUF805 domain-containing protein [Glaesserella parasuis]|uniref:DUF805 domain-containing protein n=1 Tax=Glaesserella parasuis TaxID=738 RepID=UPI0011EDF495|nr:DUF805 domain-containing protein [Glaesserella parasuis]MCT8812494.1 DUF805 domain-containing protein [Glaesserella parasuis]MCT8844151.1 DUF805 domain-containing protein [Glaesserella parasuis]MDE3966333.1 DUF805 domain-containing protein [Glaesserella parasuis]MDE3979397.1 DUF805 domain-containing protein [Glaesserella parasuis]MDE4004216.1 DUF805 domain-containing protein [Glaesserella parasuis]
MIWHKALFSFHGRLNRKGFWIGFGINFAFLFIFANFILNLTAFSWISVLPLTVSLYSLSAVIVKRLHDRNRSAKALFMVAVPILCYLSSLGSQGTMAFVLGIMMPMFIGTILVMEWGVFAGSPEANQYGEKGLSVRFK